MATINQQVQGTWVNIKAAHSLVEGTTYTLANNELQACYVAEAPSQPADAFQGVPIEHREKLHIKPTAGNGMWVRSVGTKDSTLVITEGV